MELLAFHFHRPSSYRSPVTNQEAPSRARALCLLIYSVPQKPLIAFVGPGRQSDNPLKTENRGKLGSHLFLLHLAEIFCYDVFESQVPANSLFEPADRAAHAH